MEVNIYPNCLADICVYTVLKIAQINIRSMWTHASKNTSINQYAFSHILILGHPHTHTEREREREREREICKKIILNVLNSYLIFKGSMNMNKRKLFIIISNYYINVWYS